MYKKSDFRTVGVLNQASGNIMLTPVLKGHAFPCRVVVPKSSVVGKHDDKDFLLDVAVDAINSGGLVDENAEGKVMLKIECQSR